MDQILLESGTNELEILEFRLDEANKRKDISNGSYGINVSKVTSIINIPKITGFPGSKDSCICGIFNLRNQVIPLIDLGEALNINMEDSSSKRIIITEFNSLTNGFLVSGVNRIHRVNWKEIISPDESLINCDSVTGVLKIEDRTVFMIDLEQIIASLNQDMAIKQISTPTTNQGEKHKALVVEDSVSIRNLLINNLKNSGFDVIEAKNGQEGWEKLNRHSEDLEIVITDIEMPVMDGFTLTKKIKTSTKFQNLPVIIFSSLVTEALKHKGTSVGADDQITKPEISLLATKARENIKKYQNLAKKAA